jgi:hypothetical protein
LSILVPRPEMEGDSTKILDGESEAILSS